MIPKLEYVLWKDSVSVDAWTAASDLDGELHVIESIGRLVKETSSAVILALNYDPESNDFSCSIYIPKVNIVKRSQLDVIATDRKSKNNPK